MFTPINGLMNQAGSAHAGMNASPALNIEGHVLRAAVFMQGICSQQAEASKVAL